MMKKSTLKKRVVQESDRFKVTFLDSGREPQCPSNPNFPEGKVIDTTEGAERRCETTIPYPAPRCGLMVIECKKCSSAVAVTVAGRPDDPWTVKIPCHIHELDGISKRSLN